ncbi:hypothetical protein T484DRAFT_1624132, partial [Baffinella frigidus]
PLPHTLHPTPYTLHPAPYTLHPTPCTLHPAPYTLHPTPYTLHITHTLMYLPLSLAGSQQRGEWWDNLSTRTTSHSGGPSPVHPQHLHPQHHRDTSCIYPLSAQAVKFDGQEVLGRS